MCGIAGVLDRAGARVSEVALQRMGDIMAHRGPDDAGEWADGAVGLVNRRLAILDLDPRGHMPMARGSLHITYNGELYNFRELKTDLAREGHVFRTRTDTEVVLAAYQQWGPGCVERFNGMFAFAIWDAARRELFLARDRYGIKPLYLAEIGPLVLFGSEVKALLAHGAVRAKLSPRHLLEYFTFQNIFSDGTLFDGVRLMPAGHHLTISARTGAMHEQRYWGFSFSEPAQPVDEREYVEELERLFRQAVTRQLVADVPLGAHLSGGMDSGSITAVAAGAMPWMPTFTIGFDMRSSGGMEFGRDEREKAEAMSYLFQTEHFQAVLKAGDMERCMPALVWHLEDLRVGQSYPNFYVSRLASRFAKVVLAGTGGDELFAGYPWRYYRAIVNDDLQHYVEKYYTFWHRLVPSEQMSQFLGPDVWREVSDISTVDLFRAALPSGTAPATPVEYVNASLHLEARTFLHGLLLVEDKLSMAHSVESRVPFLDNDLVEFAMRVPVRLKLRDLDRIVELNENEPGPKTEKFFERTRDGKLLLRKAMLRFVPEDVADQIKQGFSGPDASWFRGDSIEYIRRELLSSDAAIYEFLDPAGVQPLVRDHVEGRENRRLLLWSLLCFENWCRIFLAEGQPPPSFPAGAAALAH
jgi:asparagine synthase (glutamine-hydrolysing)